MKRRRALAIVFGVFALTSRIGPSTTLAAAPDVREISPAGITIDGSAYSVIGVLDSIGSSTTSDEDDTVVIPGTTNRLGAWGAQLAPRAFVRRIAGKLQG